MKRLAIPWGIALFFLVLFGCDKDKPDPECKDASCCNPELNGYVEYITDIPAHLSGPPQFTGWAFRTPRGYPTGKVDPYKTHLLGICENSMGMIKGFTPDTDPFDSTKITYPYRISGKVLADVKGQWFSVTPVLYIYIDKIEKVK